MSATNRREAMAFPKLDGPKDTGQYLTDAYGTAHVAVMQWEYGAPASTVLDTARRAAEELRHAIARLEAHTGDQPGASPLRHSV